MGVAFTSVLALLLQVPLALRASASGSERAARTGKARAARACMCSFSCASLEKRRLHVRHTGRTAASSCVTVGAACSPSPARLRFFLRL